MEIDAATISRLKEIFVTRDECNDNVKEISERITDGEKDALVFKTKLNILIGGVVLLLTILLPIAFKILFNVK